MLMPLMICPHDNTHIIATVLFRFRDNSDGIPISITTIVTANQKQTKVNTDMTPPIFNYDEISDTLYISFVRGEQCNRY